MMTLLTRHSKTLLIFVLLVALTLVCGWLEPRFLSRDSLGAVLKYAGLFGVIALGVSFVILTGGIDLSIGSWVGLCAVLYPVLLKQGLGVGEAGASRFCQPTRSGCAMRWCWAGRWRACRCRRCFY